MTGAKAPNDVSLVLCGEAGQGIQTIEHFLTRVFKRSGFNVYATKEYMSRVRGGTNSTEIRVSSERVTAFVKRIDVLVALAPGAVPWLARRLGEGTLILGDREHLGKESEAPGCRLVEIPLGKLAEAAGGAIFTGTVAAGVVSGLFGLRRETLEDYLRERFGEKGEKVLAGNLAAAGSGLEIGSGLVESLGFATAIEPRPGLDEEILVNGAEAVALGAIAGGCDFVASYPMSPSTAVLVFLANQARGFGIVVEQAEDEIAAVNMALGAWYAGGRAMVTTSGGGFALMTEGVSLAGMTESPLVVHLGQRPGPATGLPTRTEQGDLNLALHAGHGEFPRAILAPGTIEEAFDLSRRAFDLADAFQVPVFVLTDQHLLDSYHNTPPLDASGPPPRKHTVPTDAGYRRYAHAPDGLSPRGVPGFGDGLVHLDSDEHDTDGHITEREETRVAMTRKRLAKRRLLEEAALPPVLVGDPDYRTLVVGWGSTCQAAAEALRRLDRPDLAYLHLRQVYPLHPGVGERIRQAGRWLVMEGNATSQLGRLIRAETGLAGLDPILRYGGSPFSVEGIAERLASLPEGG